jgi:hypothetical protein
MRQRTNILVGTESTLRFIEARNLSRAILPIAAEEVIERYVAGLRTANGGALTTGHVIETLENLLAEDPLAELAVVMEEAGREVHRPGTHSIHIHASGDNAQLIAMEAAGIAQEHDDIIVWATNDRGDWACTAWHQRNLVSVYNFGGRERWRHQVLPRPMSPSAAAHALRSAIASGQGTRGLPGIRMTRPKHSPTPEARAILSMLGVESPRTPPCCADPD